MATGGFGKKVFPVILIERNAVHRGLLGEELSRQGFSVDSVADEHALLNSPDMLHRAGIIVLGPSLPIASALSLSVRLHNAGSKAAVVNLADVRRIADRRGRNDATDGLAARLRHDDVLRNLKQLATVVAQRLDRPTHDLVRGPLVLRSDGVTMWNDVEVPLTSVEVEIVKLLARNFGEFVSYGAIYGLRHRNPAGVDAHHQRSSVRSAVKRIRRKFRNCDSTFAEIRIYRAFGYRWG